MNLQHVAAWLPAWGLGIGLYISHQESKGVGLGLGQWAIRQDRIVATSNHQKLNVRVQRSRAQGQGPKGHGPKKQGLQIIASLAALVWQLVC